ncbi:MAG: LamG domain-containing protein, partial [Holophagales bacterium]|nr:LamG domain-containing protein [Holophagales bacterium]
LGYSTCIDETVADIHMDVEVDALDRAHVLGKTDSPSFATTPGALDPTHNGGLDLVLMRFDATGSTAEYATYLGGSGDDCGRDLALDAAGGAHFTGHTDSVDLPALDPLSSPANGGSLQGGKDVLVGQIGTAGTPLRYLSYLGGTSGDFGAGLDVAADGRICLTGYTLSEHFPTLGVPPALPALQPFLAGATDAFATCILGDAPCADPPDGMAAWWPLDEPAGLTAAELVGGRDGFHVANPLPIPGRVAGALAFDGLSDSVRVGYHPSLDPGTGDFSLDFWVRSDWIDKQTIFDAFGPGDLEGYRVATDADTLYFQMGDGLNSIYVLGTVPLDNAWHFVAITVDRDDPAGGVFYLDGAPVSTFDPTLHPGSLTSGADLHMATRWDGSRNLRGDLDEVELFHRVLEPAEVLDIYQAGGAGKCKPDTDLERPDPWLDDTPYYTVPGLDSGIEPNPMAAPLSTSRSIWVVNGNTPSTDFQDHE